MTRTRGKQTRWWKALLLVGVLGSALYFAVFRSDDSGPEPVIVEWTPAEVPESDGAENDAAFTPDVPRTWDDSRVASTTLPNPHPDAAVTQVSADYYYAIRTEPIYQSYPVYRPEHEPAGYRDELLEQDAKVLHIDWSNLKTRQDWAQAGELVFHKPLGYAPMSLAEERAERFGRPDAPVASDGTVPFARFYIREKGKLEVGGLSCATCHTRVLPDGSVIYGAQGQFPTPALGFGDNTLIARRVLRLFFAAPWLENDPIEAVEEMDVDEIYGMLGEFPLGVMPRHGTSPWYPVQIPDLIGIKDRRYLDRTGLARHRDVSDLMRYAAMNQTTDVLAKYGNYVPVSEMQIFSDEAPAPEDVRFPRYSDEELYALALYLYSLEAPPNPNPFDETAEHGQEVFDAEGCGGCHTPPLYTNNKLTPAKGFDIPAEHREKYDILDVSVGTDPNLALRTRRATGYYKVPSLKGVWYRSYFGHSGWCETLEDWFDPARLREDYVPTGFRNVGKSSHAVPGHEFGLGLSEDDRTALVAFLKTL